MPSHHLILCCPLLLPSSIFPSIKVFSNKSGHDWSDLAAAAAQPKYCSFSFNVSPSNEYLGLISFRTDLGGSSCSPRDSQVSSPTPQFKSINYSVLSFIYGSTLFMAQLSYPYMTTGKSISLTRHTFFSKVISLLLNMLSSLVTAFLRRSNHLLISWLQSPFTVILEPPKNKVSLFPLFSQV